MMKQSRAQQSWAYVRVSLGARVAGRAQAKLLLASESSASFWYANLAGAVVGVIDERGRGRYNYDEVWFECRQLQAMERLEGVVLWWWLDGASRRCSFEN